MATVPTNCGSEILKNSSTVEDFISITEMANMDSDVWISWAVGASSSVGVLQTAIVNASKGVVRDNHCSP